MIVNLLRRSLSPIFEMSISSTKMRPLVGSTKRKNDKARVLLPEPVRPRTPIFSPGLISKLSSWRTLGKSGYSDDTHSSLHAVRIILLTA